MNEAKKQGSYTPWPFLVQIQCHGLLILKVPSKTCSWRHSISISFLLFYFFFFFRENKSWHFMWIIYSYDWCLTLSVPNYRQHLSSAFFFILTNYPLERPLYVKLKDWAQLFKANDVSDSLKFTLSDTQICKYTEIFEPSHLDLCCLQKPVIIACGRERVKGLI